MTKSAVRMRALRYVRRDSCLTSLGVPLVLLLPAFVGRFSRRLRWLTAGAFLLIVLQYASVNIGRDLGAPTMAALHAVNALLVFWVAVTLVQSAMRAMGQSKELRN